MEQPTDPDLSAPDRDLPKKEGVEALLTLIADQEDRAVLDRILEALTINHRPTDADIERYDELWDMFGEDTEADPNEDDDSDPDPSEVV